MSNIVETVKIKADGGYKVINLNDLKKSDTLLKGEVQFWGSDSIEDEKDEQEPSKSSENVDKKESTKPTKDKKDKK